MAYTYFSEIYDSFFSRITDDMYMELTELDTYRMLQELLVNAIFKFEFPRTPIHDTYVLIEPVELATYNGVESDYKDAELTIYGGGYFTVQLTREEINIIAIYMVVEWLSQQLANVDLAKQMYQGKDFSFTSQAAHMNALTNLKKEYEREGFHMQRLYSRRMKDSNGVMQSTLIFD